LKDDKKMTISRNLKDFESRLKGYPFFRTHQSHLINLKAFNHFVKSDGGYIVMDNEKNIPISPKKKNEFFDIIENL